jgi:hypothetical protein
LDEHGQDEVLMFQRQEQADARMRRRQEQALIDLQATIRIPMAGVPPFWLVNPYAPLTMAQAVLKQHDDEWCIEVVQASTWAESHADINQCLEDFVRLFDATQEPGRVLAFVHEYGFADFCPHAYKNGGVEGLRTSIPWQPFSNCPQCDFGKTLPRRELVRAYVMCARQLRAALKLADDLRIAEATAKEWREKVTGIQKTAAHSEDVKSLFFDEFDPGFFYALEVEKQWEQLAYVAYSWLDRAKPEIWPSVAKDGNGVSIQIRAYTLLKILALQFSAAISAPERCYICDVCLNPYQPDRKPRRDKRALCRICSASPGVINVWKRTSWNKRQAELGRPRQRKSKYSGEIAEA